MYWVLHKFYKYDNRKCIIKVEICKITCKSLTWNPLEPNKPNLESPFVYAITPAFYHKDTSY